MKINSFGGFFQIVGRVTKPGGPQKGIKNYFLTVPVDITKEKVKVLKVVTTTDPRWIKSKPLKTKTNVVTSPTINCYKSLLAMAGRTTTDGLLWNRAVRFNTKVPPVATKESTRLCTNSCEISNTSLV